MSTLRPSVEPREVVFVIEDVEAGSKNLGTQFVFGLVPVTRLFVERGEQSFLAEAFVDYLASLNIASFVVPERVLLPELAACGVQLRPSFIDLSINAYDLLFFRRMCVAGDVQLAVRRNSAEHFYAEPLDDCRLTSFAYSPQLSAFLEKQTFAALRTLWEQLGAERIRRKQSETCLTLNRPLLVVAAPTFHPSLQQSSSTAETSAPTKPNTLLLSRTWQRGMQQFGASRNVAIALPLVPQDSSEMTLRHIVEQRLPGAWIVESEILTSQRIEDELRLQVRVELVETRNGHSVTLQRSQCLVNVLSHSSAADLVGLEMNEAGAKALEKFFNHECEER